MGRDAGGGRGGDQGDICYCCVENRVSTEGTPH